MKLKTMSNQIFPKKKNSRLRQRRAVTDIISTMMLMGVTVTGASTLTYFVNDAFLTGDLASSALGASSMNISLLAYDTRDSINLLTLDEIDNENNSLLCRASCIGNPNDIPANTGTEFIVFQIRNNNLDSIFLEDVIINGVVHSWDSSTSGDQLIVSGPLVGGEYPADGTFSILPIGSSPIFQNDNTQIQSGQIVNILVKLDSVDADIALNKGIQILLNVGDLYPIEFLLESGGAQ